jgi:hypothetical protein
MHDVLQNLIKQFMPFAQKQIGFTAPPMLFLKNDTENAKNPLGKTAFYDPGAKSITLYVTGRHPKDILRSLGHELVHHKQNCDGQFEDAGDMGEGYAQKNPHLRRMEQDANRDGSMCLRDFEDKLKKENTIYYEHLQKGDNKMSTKDWKNEEIRTLLAEAWGFKFNTLQEFDEFNGNGEVQTEAEEEIEELAGATQATRGRKGRPMPKPAKEDEKEKMSENEDEDDDEVVEETIDEETEDTSDAVEERRTGRADPRRTRGVADTRQRALEEEEEKEDEQVDESTNELKEAIAAVLRKHLRD